MHIFVRAKYRYGFVITDVDEEVNNYDKRCDEYALKGDHRGGREANVAIITTVLTAQLAGGDGGSSDCEKI